MKYLLGLLLISNVCFGLPLYKKGTCVQFKSNTYGECYGVTVNVSKNDYDGLFEYDVVFQSCSTGYIPNAALYIYLEKDLKLCK